MERVINSLELRGANCKCLPSVGVSEQASETIRGARSLLTTAEVLQPYQMAARREPCPTKCGSAGGSPYQMRLGGSLALPNATRREPCPTKCGSAGALPYQMAARREPCPTKWRLGGSLALPNAARRESCPTKCPLFEGAKVIRERRGTRTKQRGR
jgi:hypothetical protein